MKRKRFYDDDETFRQKMLARVRVVEKKIREFMDLPTRVKAQKILDRLKIVLKNKKIRFALVMTLWLGLSALERGIRENTDLEYAAVYLQYFPESYQRTLIRLRERYASQGELPEIVERKLTAFFSNVARAGNQFVSRIDRRLDRDSVEVKSFLGRIKEDLPGIIRHDLNRQYFWGTTNFRDSYGYRWLSRLSDLTQEYRRYYNRDIAENQQERAETERIAREAARMAEQRRREREAEFGH